MSQRILWRVSRPGKGCYRQEKSSGPRRTGEMTGGRATAGQDRKERPAGWWRGNCQLQPSTCQCGPGRGARCAAAQDNKYNRDRSKSPPACLTSALQAPGNKVSGWWARAHRKGPERPGSAPARGSPAVRGGPGTAGRRPGAG